MGYKWNRELSISSRYVILKLELSYTKAEKKWKIWKQQNRAFVRGIAKTTSKLTWIERGRENIGPSMDSMLSNEKKMNWIGIFRSRSLN